MFYCNLGVIIISYYFAILMEIKINGEESSEPPKRINVGVLESRCDK